ncbi:alpha/beta hydrolase [Nocardioides sp.]|uniref:alpha/beta hydrolase n=1 Tax=Nocardioides sp. TaxID=35761 RepID=UPI002B27BC2C|nr:alpha/beta fold hydrolase [Nocardioides sp.]
MPFTPAAVLGRRSSAFLALSLLATLLVGGPGSAPAAAEVSSSTTQGVTSSDRSPSASPRARFRKVSSARVRFDLVNTNDSSVICMPGPDGEEYRVRGTLVAPRAVLRRRQVLNTVNVLVHDAGTGGWSFNLKGNPTYDYASNLAAKGHTSLVLDRLGYDRSPLADGTDTCLGAQVHLLHQVVQHLRAGKYDFLGSRSGASSPHAFHVVLQGHGTGATIAQLEAAHFDDVAGLVLLAPATTNPSQLALETVRAQGETCLNAGFAAYGANAAAYRKLLFRTAPSAVQKKAVQLRNPTPCGDVSSLPSALAATTLGGGLGDMNVEVPVLQLLAGADARTNGGGASITSTEKIVRRTIKGAGSTLMLEKSAPKSQRIVTRWLDRL